MNNPEAVTVSQGPGSPSTPPGFNKKRRDTCRFFLALTALALLFGELLWATVLSAASIFILKEGTLWSTKNIKWMTLSCISVVASLVSLLLERGSHVVDEDKAYTFKLSLWLMSKSIVYFWSVILGLFLLSASSSSSGVADPSNDNSLSNTAGPNKKKH